MIAPGLSIDTVRIPPVVVEVRHLVWKHKNHCKNCAEISVRVSLKVCPGIGRQRICKLLECWPVWRTHAINTWLLILVLLHYLHLLRRAQNHTLPRYTRTTALTPEFISLKHSVSLPQMGPKGPTQQIQEVADCTPWHLLLSSACCVPKKHPAKSPSGTEWYGQSMWGKSQVASLGSAFLISKLLHRLISILNKRKITTGAQENTDIRIFLPVSAVFMSARD